MVYEPVHVLPHGFHHVAPQPQKTVGQFPWLPRSTGMVVNLTPAEKARQDAIDARKANMLDINQSIITEQDKIDEIRATVIRSAKDHDLAKSVADFENADDFFRFCFTESKNNNAIMLSTPPPCAGYQFDMFMPHFM